MSDETPPPDPPDRLWMVLYEEPFESWYTTTDRRYADNAKTFEMPIVEYIPATPATRAAGELLEAARKAWQLLHENTLYSKEAQDVYMTLGSVLARIRESSAQPPAPESASGRGEGEGDA